MPAKGNSPEYGSVCGYKYAPEDTGELKKSPGIWARLREGVFSLPHFYGALNLSFSIFPAVAGLFFRR